VDARASSLGLDVTTEFRQTQRLFRLWLAQFSQSFRLVVQLPPISCQRRENGARPPLDDGLGFAADTMWKEGPRESQTKAQQAQRRLEENDNEPDVVQPE